MPRDCIAIDLDRMPVERRMHGVDRASASPRYGVDAL
jgi:hypothetical protein